MSRDDEKAAPAHATMRATLILACLSLGTLVIIVTLVCTWPLGCKRVEEIKRGYEDVKRHADAIESSAPP